MLPFGLYILKGTSKTILEFALEYYAKSIIKNNSGYMAHHIDNICEKETPEFADTYATRHRGYYSLEKTLEKITVADTQLANEIKLLMYKLHEDNDGDDDGFVIIDEQ